MRSSPNRAGRQEVRFGCSNGEFASAVINGLSMPKKSIPCRFFYDTRGSELFEEITRLEEYYTTRTEAAILSEYADEIIGCIRDDAVLIEFGSGSSLKTEILLDRVPEGVTYVPIDVSRSALDEAEARLACRYPALKIRPILGDFMGPISIPSVLMERPKVGFFPGSTIGNFSPQGAVGLLRAFQSVLSTDGRLIIGVDLKKDPRVLVRAYADSAGVTAAFNLNILARMNRELGADIDLASFRHEAIYDPVEGRIEMHLVSNIEQDLWVCGFNFSVKAGESIHTENSYKFSVAQFQGLARDSGWTPNRLWTDGEQKFSIHELIVT
jgi:dimethylhistidine N-methyltransferase